MDILFKFFFLIQVTQTDFYSITLKMHRIMFVCVYKHFMCTQ